MSTIRRSYDFNTRNIDGACAKTNGLLKATCSERNYLHESYHVNPNDTIWTIIIFSLFLPRIFRFESLKSNNVRLCRDPFRFFEINVQTNERRFWPIRLENRLRNRSVRLYGTFYALKYWFVYIPRGWEINGIYVRVGTWLVYQTMKFRSIYWFPEIKARSG